MTNPSTDIVERLRAIAGLTLKEYSRQTIYEAADEIERLRRLTAAKTSKPLSNEEAIRRLAKASRRARNCDDG